jgi:lipopolysaccharide export system protein LptA
MNVGRVKKFGCLVTSFALAASLSTGALAQSTQMEGMKLSNDQPIQIESDQLEVHDQSSSAVFTGNVNVVQGTTTLKAGKMTVYYVKQGQSSGGAASVTSGNADIDKIDVSDNVFLSSETQQATADTGHFDMQAQTFVLQGKQVVLSQGQNVFVGCKLTVHMQTGEAKLDACGGRVKIQLDPKSKQKP